MQLKRIGFVVSHEEKDPRRMVAGCVANFTDGEDSIWRWYLRGDTKFLRSLFILAVLVKQKLTCVPELGLTEGAVLLDVPKCGHNLALTYLFDVWRQGTRYRAIPPELRKEMRVFFPLHGRRSSFSIRTPKDGLR